MLGGYQLTYFNLKTWGAHYDIAEINIIGLLDNLGWCWGGSQLISVWNLGARIIFLGVRILIWAEISFNGFFDNSGWCLGGSQLTYFNLNPWGAHYYSWVAHFDFSYNQLQWFIWQLWLMLGGFPTNLFQFETLSVAEFRLGCHIKYYIQLEGNDSHLR